jgi:DNA-binding NtrC family response regulator
LDAATADAALFGEEGQPGRLELAVGGTLFVEDAARLDAGLQRRLAEKLGAEGRGALRVIVSTGTDSPSLEPALLAVVDVVRIRVPALSERREDISLLAERSMNDLAREYGRPAKRLSAEALMALKTHDWPGNVTELSNLVERLLLFAPGEVVERGDLPEKLGGARPPLEDLYGDFASLEEGVRAFERYFVARVLAERGADRDDAAKRLGISREELDRKTGWA